MKHFGAKVELDGYQFDSKKEAQFYLAYIKPLPEQFRLIHPTYPLFGKFAVGGYNQRGRSYTPDFVVLDGSGGFAHVYDVKTSVSTYAVDTAAMLRFSMFAKRYRHPVEVVAPTAHGFKMKLFGFTKQIQPAHVSKSGKKSYYHTFQNVDYDLKEIIGE